jgi:hypothetical protein
MCWLLFLFRRLAGHLLQNRDPPGVRGAAIIALLYACGLRGGGGGKPEPGRLRPGNWESDRQGKAQQRKVQLTTVIRTETLLTVSSKAPPAHLKSALGCTDDTRNSFVSGVSQLLGDTHLCNLGVNQTTH